MTRIVDSSPRGDYVIALLFSAIFMLGVVLLYDTIRGKQEEREIQRELSQQHIVVTHVLDSTADAPESH